MKNTKKTNNISQPFDSKNQTDYKWLQDVYKQKKLRVYQLGVKAIDSLVKDGMKVTYRTITDRSKKIDDEGKGIHQNSIKTNTELYEYYQNHCSSKQPISGIKPSKINVQLMGDQYFRNIKIDRDLVSVAKRYSSLSKKELLELLINAEQYIAEQNQLWLKNEFEKFIQ